MLTSFIVNTNLIKKFKGFLVMTNPSQDANESCENIIVGHDPVINQHFLLQNLNCFIHLKTNDGSTSFTGKSAFI